MFVGFAALNMLVGFLEPSEGAGGLLDQHGVCSASFSRQFHFKLALPLFDAGTAIVEGHDIRREMRTIYQLMGVCPQVCP